MITFRWKSRIVCNVLPDQENVDQDNVWPQFQAMCKNQKVAWERG